MTPMQPDSRVFVAGHEGLVGSALVRQLAAQGFRNLFLRHKRDLDLRDRAAVDRFFRAERPEYVFLAAGKVGGIEANRTFPADFLNDNLLIQCNVIDSAYLNGVTKLLFLGSSCIYPKHAPQPIREESLLTGPLEPTNEWYAIAKIAGLKMCQAYRRQFGFQAISAMPTNLYGPGDNFSLESSHVLPALLRKFHDARVQGAESVTVWGTGTPLREFLHVDDLADACLFLMQNYDEDSWINLGSGSEVSIADLATMIAEIVGFKGELRFDRSKPDGTPRKRLDVSRLDSVGWRAKIDLRAGIESTYAWFLGHDAQRRM
jgi:GDP-L-fucose synthase